MILGDQETLQNVQEFQRLSFRVAHFLTLLAKSALLFMFKDAVAAGDYFLPVRQPKGQVHEYQAFPKSAFPERFRKNSLGYSHGLALGAQPWPWSLSMLGTVLNWSYIPLEPVSPTGESVTSGPGAST